MSVANYLNKVKSWDLPASDKALLTASGLGLGAGATGHLLNGDESTPVASGLTGAGLAALTALGLGKLPAVNKYIGKSFDDSVAGKELAAKGQEAITDYRDAAGKASRIRKDIAAESDYISQGGGYAGKSPEEMRNAILGLFGKRQAEALRTGISASGTYNDKMKEAIIKVLNGKQVKGKLLEDANSLIQELQKHAIKRTLADANVRKAGLEASLEEALQNRAATRAATKETLNKIKGERNDYIDFSKMAMGGGLTAAGGTGGAIMGYENPLGG